jgi:hypothetical protein
MEAVWLGVKLGLLIPLCCLLLQYTTKMPPAKRAKANSPAAQLQKQLAAANAHRTIGGKPGQCRLQAVHCCSLASCECYILWLWCGCSAGAWQAAMATAVQLVLS